MPEDSIHARRGEFPSSSQTNRQRLTRIWLATVVILCAGLALCYWLRPDGLAAFTILPVWCWFLLGLLLTAFGWHRRLARRVILVAAMWFLFLLIFADEPRSVLRALMPLSDEDEARSLRVVSLNCGGGDPAAAGEVATGVPMWCCFRNRHRGPRSSN
jgi:hypothetical protein